MAVEPRQIVLRAATPRDLTPLYNCMLGYFDDCKPFYPPPVETDCMESLLAIVAKNGVILAECEGSIVGSLAVEIGNFPWNKKAVYLNTPWLYVVPGFRKGGTAFRFFKAAKEIADKNNLPLRMDDVWGFYPELQERLKAILGFTRIGGCYAYFPTSKAEVA